VRCCAVALLLGELLVTLGSVLRGGLVLLMQPFAAQRGVVGELTGGSLPASKQSVEQRHRLSPLGSGRYARSYAADTIAAALARKPRTPPPPRRVQAPQTRKVERELPRLRLVGAGVAALLAIGGVVAFFALRGGASESESVAQAMRAAGCTYQTYPAQEAAHINDEDATPEEWNSFPPSSGPHFVEPAILGSYDEPVPITRAVHNLEHGAVVIWYGDDVADTQVAELESFYADDPTGMLLSPLPRLGDEIALTAWNQPSGSEEGGLGILATCTRFDEDAFAAFRDELRFQGPERFPPESLQPGS
jgi:hypothetical protein